MHSIGHKLIRKSFFLPRPATDRKPEADTDTESERNIMQQQNAECHTQAKSDTESVTQRTIGRRCLLTILLKRLFLFIRYVLILFAVQIRTSRYDQIKHIRYRFIYHYFIINSDIHMNMGYKQLLNLEDHRLMWVG